MVLAILDTYTRTREIIDLVFHQNSIVKTKAHHGQHCWGMESSDHIKPVIDYSSCTNFVCLFPLPYHMSLLSHKVKKSTKAIPHLASTWKSSSFRQAPKLPYQTFYNLSKTCGDITKLKLGSISTVIISSTKLAQEVLKTHDLVFAYRPNSIVSHFLSYDGQSVGWAPYGDYWKQMRRLSMLELFNTKSLEASKNVRDEEFSFLVRRIFEDCKVICLSSIFTRRLLVHLVLNYF
jgi:hypothetical protein